MKEACVQVCIQRMLSIGGCMIRAPCGRVLQGLFRMRVFHFALGYTRGMSGGDESTLQVIRRFVERGMANTAVTTERGRNMYMQLGLAEGDLLRFVTIPDYWSGRGDASLLLAYARRTRHAWKALPEWQIEPDDVLLCCSSSFANSIPFARLARRHPPENLFYWIHMLEPRLWFGFEGTYTGRRSVPTPKRINFILQQRLYRRLIRPGSTVITCNPMYRSTLEQLLPRNPIYAVRRFGGVAIPATARNPTKKCVYDVAWMGRFHEQKGLFDILTVAERLKSQRPNLRVLVIGGGTAHMEARFRTEIRRRGLETCIDWPGTIVGDERFRKLQCARVFLMPSTFESFGLVILEAMKCGLPVVAYDLPVYHVFARGMITTPVGDTSQIAHEVRRLLEDETHWAAKRQEALDFAQDFSWDKTGDEIYALVTHSETAAT